MINALLEKIILLTIRIITFDYYVIKREIKRVQGSAKSVLDLGSGTGYLSTLFDRRVYVGYELQEELVNDAKTNYLGYRFYHGDATQINIRRKFDLILIIGVIHHLDNNGFFGILRTVKKHLSTQGKALVIEAIPPLSKYNLLGKLIRKLDRGDYIRSIRSYRTRMEKSFRVIEAEKRKGGIVDYAIFVLVGKQGKK